MLDAAAKAELMRALGRLVRGLSALFWGLPLALVVCVRTAMGDSPRPLGFLPPTIGAAVGILPPVVVMSLLFYGVLQLGHFQKQERIWRLAVERAQILGIVNIGLAPFIFWWNQLPYV